MHSAVTHVMFLNLNEKERQCQIYRYAKTLESYIERNQEARAAVTVSEIKQGDAIDLEWFDQRSGRLHERAYAVAVIRVVEPQNVRLLEPTSEDSLPLVTCYPFGRGPGSPQRYVVRASPVGRESGSPPEWQD